MTTAASSASASLHGERLRRRSWLFVGLPVVLAIVTILGFSPGYFWPRLTGQPPLPLLQHWASPSSVLIAIFFAPILVAAAYDWRKRGRPHALYAVGFVIYLLRRRRTMMRPHIAFAALAAFSWTSPCLAQSATPHGIADQFAQAWSTHDRAAFDRLFTDDAHFIPTYDLVAEGRANVVTGIYQGHQQGTGPFRETTLTPSKVSVQQLGADAAVVHFNVSIHLPPGRNLPPLERTLHLVVVKQQDGWRIASGQLTKPNCAPGGGPG